MLCCLTIFTLFGRLNSLEPPKIGGSRRRSNQTTIVILKFKIYRNINYQGGGCYKGIRICSSVTKRNCVFVGGLCFSHKFIEICLHSQGLSNMIATWSYRVVYAESFSWVSWSYTMVYAECVATLRLELFVALRYLQVSRRACWDLVQLQRRSN